MIWAVRNIVHSGLLARLCKEADVVVFLRSPSPEVERLCRSQGADVWIVPSSFKKDSAVYLRTRNWLEKAHKERVDVDSEKIKQSLIRRNLSATQKVRLQTRDFVFRIVGRSVAYPLLDRVERRLFEQAHDVEPIVSYMREQKTDLLLLTAPLQSESGETALMRACKRASVTMAAMVLGFDNLTTKGRFYELADYFMVWNEKMKRELASLYPSVSPNTVFVTGSPQFDFYADPYWGTDEMCSAHDWASTQPANHPLFY